MPARRRRRRCARDRGDASARGGARAGLGGLLGPLPCPLLGRWLARLLGALGARWVGAWLAASLAATVAVAAAAPALAERTASAPAARSASPAAARSTARIGDPLESAECQRALAALSARGSGACRVVAGLRRRDDERPASRRVPAGVGTPLGGEEPASRVAPIRATLSAERLVRPAPSPTAPVVVAPASARRRRQRPRVPRRSRPPRAPAERPYAITSCDSGGCWANDGSRLNRVGPNLWGPRGICTVQGSLVQCP